MELTRLERDDVARRVTLTWAGTFEVGPVIESLRRRVAEGIWAYASLQDATAVTTGPSSSDLNTILQEVIELSQRHGHAGPMALLVSLDVSYGMGRVYQAISEARHGHFMVFRARDEADRWLAGNNPDSHRT